MATVTKIPDAASRGLATPRRSTAAASRAAFKALLLRDLTVLR
jgi:hypothetical protein